MRSDFFSSRSLQIELGHANFNIMQTVQIFNVIIKSKYQVEQLNVRSDHIMK